MPPPPPPAARRRRRRRVPRWLWWLAVIPGLLVVVGLVGLLTVLFISLPLPVDRGGPAVLLDAGGTPFAQLTSEVTRRDVELSSLPQHTIDAVVAAEDGDFYRHAGVDPVSVGRAIIANIRHGEVSQGGSTISQQYIKVASGDNAQTVWRKLTEAALALKLERTHTKDEILQLYLNSVYFGRGAYGIQAAAQAYFGVDAAALTLPQSAVLAGVLPAPSLYDPLVDNRASHLRYRYVLGEMVDHGWLDAATRDALLAAQPPTVARRTASRNQSPWATDLVRRELEALGFADGAGLTIHTSLDMQVQAHAERAHASAFADTTATGAIVAVDPSSGGVLAIVGGKDYGSDQLNTALARRQPGSTFKPVALAAWLDDGRSARDVFAAPGQITLDGADGGQDWAVANYGGRDLGSVTLAEATWHSSNTAYAQLAVNLGADRIADVGDALVGEAGRFQPLPSLVLGTQETSPLELAGVYATFAADGVRHQPHIVVEVRRGEEVVYRAPVGGPRVLDEDTARGVTDVLTGVVASGTGRGAAIGRPVAGKTGTTQDHGDAWFAGYTPQIAAVVWMGNRDDRSPLAGEETGGGLPASTFAAFMSAAHEGMEVRAFTPPTDRAGAAVSVPTSTATPTPTATPSPTLSASATPTPTPTSTATVEAGPTHAPTPTPAPPRPQPTSPPAGSGDADPLPRPTPTPQPAPTAAPATEGPAPRPTTAASPPPPQVAPAPAATAAEGEG